MGFARGDLHYWSRPGVLATSWDGLAQWKNDGIASFSLTPRKAVVEVVEMLLGVGCPCVQGLANAQYGHTRGES
jgi:hypothetical protein